MAAYAVCLIAETKFGAEITQYLNDIDETLKPYEGKFRIHGGPYQQVEGVFTGDLVIIEFADMHTVQQWYESPNYRRIKFLRTNNSVSTMIFVDGVSEGHRANDILN